MDLYHVVNRGTDKRSVVKCDGDRIRFVRGLYVFNDKNYAPNPLTQPKLRDSNKRKRKVLVHIHAWCLMDNHYHLLLSPVADDVSNISLFMKKLNMGYAKFFNEKYQRTGALWQGKYKKVLVGNAAHDLYIPYYIHLNPLDINHKQWRKGNISDSKTILKKLDAYRWSSYLDYTGTSNFPSLLYRNILDKTLKTKENQHQEMSTIITDQNLIENSNIIEI